MPLCASFCASCTINSNGIFCLWCLHHVNYFYCLWFFSFFFFFRLPRHKYTLDESDRGKWRKKSRYKWWKRRLICEQIQRSIFIVIFLFSSSSPTSFSRLSSSSTSCACSNLSCKPSCLISHITRCGDYKWENFNPQFLRGDFKLIIKNDRDTFSCFYFLYFK